MTFTIKFAQIIKDWGLVLAKQMPGHREMKGMLGKQPLIQLIEEFFIVFTGRSIR